MRRKVGQSMVLDRVVAGRRDVAQAPNALAAWKYPPVFSLRTLLSGCVPDDPYAFDGDQRATRHHFVEDR
jgi:hypothetical protein